MGLLIAAFFGLLAAGAWDNGAHYGAAFIAALGAASVITYYVKKRG